MGAIIGATACAAAQLAIAQQSQDAPAARYPAGSITTVEQADRALSFAATERDAAEQRYAAEQEKCYTKFFATSCMDEARERRRKALADIRAVEVQANEFKRKERAAERDREAAQRIADSEAKRADHERQLLQKQQNEAAADAGEKQVAPEAPREAAVSSDGKTDRVIRHEAKVRREQSAQAANAARRAENVAAYERKQKEAEARLKEVENRRAEKERERSRKSVSEAASTPAR